MSGAFFSWKILDQHPAPSIHHQEIPGEDEPGPSTTSPPWAPVPNACSVHPKCHESFGDSKRNNETTGGKKNGRAYQNNNNQINGC